MGGLGYQLWDQIFSVVSPVKVSSQIVQLVLCVLRVLHGCLIPTGTRFASERTNLSSNLKRDCPYLRSRLRWMNARSYKNLSQLIPKQAMRKQVGWKAFPIIVVSTKVHSVRSASSCNLIFYSGSKDWSGRMRPPKAPD